MSQRLTGRSTMVCASSTSTSTSNSMQLADESSRERTLDKLRICLSWLSWPCLVPLFVHVLSYKNADGGCYHHLEVPYLRCFLDSPSARSVPFNAWGCSIGENVPRA